MQIFVFKKKNLWILGGYCGKKKKPWGFQKTTTPLHMRYYALGMYLQIE
jgi:hypothetical protein